ncbi:hypothetical protein GCM10028791_11960 [Echinicola sediminis]
MKYLLLFSLLVFYFSSFAQKTYQFAEKTVRQNEQTLTMPFAGGINAAQIQTMDVNGNGLEEWVIWDINSRNIKVFENQNDEFHYLPYMPQYFPDDVSGFLVLADFDADGKKDLFTSTPFGIKAYRNTSKTGDSVPSWEVVETFLKLENGTNFQANNLDVPAIQDIDGDGDLDIVTFNFAAGDYLEYYQNTSVERTGSPGIDGFAASQIRWGNFEFCGCGNFSFGQTCQGNPISRKIPGDENSAILHSGGHSILLKDFNDDGLLDIVMGQDECNTLYYLPNVGSNTAPIFNSFSTSLPGMGPFPQFPLFHVAQTPEDRFLISTNSSETTLTANIDFAQSIYQLNKNSNPALITASFLQEDMIDLGENSRPFFKGNYSDGTLIVTANTIKESKPVGQAFRYHWTNNGMELMESDYLDLSSLNLTELQYVEYTSTDQNNYLFISGTEIEDFILIRKLYFAPNLQVGQLTEIELPNIILRPNDHFEFFRSNGEDFLLLARQTGELRRYKVTFGEKVEFELLDENYLGFTDNPSSRNLVVKTALVNGQLDLFAVDQQGILNHISDFIHSATQTSVLLDMPDGSKKTSKLGRNTWIAALPEVFGAKTHLILGNRAGGLQLLEDSANGSTPPSGEGLKVSLYPNPVADNTPLKIIANESGQARLINSLGQLIHNNISIEAGIPQEITTSTLASGLYFVEFISGSGKRITKKLIVY